MRRINILAAALAILVVLTAFLWAGSVVACMQQIVPVLTIKSCSTSIRFGPWQGKDLAWAYNNRGNAYYDLGKLSQAIEDYDEALRLDPGFA